MDITEIAPFYEHSLDDISAIRRLAAIQTAKNRIEMFDNQPDPTAFMINFFSIAELAEVDQWLTESAAPLSREEAASYRR